MKIDQDVKARAIAVRNAKANYRKFKETGKTRYQDKANYNYGLVKGYDAKLNNTATRINKTTVTTKASVNIDKSKKYSVNHSFNRKAK